MSAAPDIVYRLSYRIGRLEGRGWPFSWLCRHILADLYAARSEIERLRKLVEGWPQ